MTGNQSIYFMLYQQYKDITAQKEDRLLKKYVIPTSDVFKNKLMEYNPIET